MRGGTVTFAEGAGATPDWIFPIVAPAYFSTANIEQFGRLMWRSLYWIGKNGEPVINSSESMAYPPIYSDGNRKVTVKLKPWRWSDGEPVTARDVQFWFNLVKANKLQDAAYTPGEFPDNVSRFVVDGPSTFTLYLTQPYSPNWYTYNELSQITPLPQHAWDKTSASGKVTNLDLTAAGAKKVFSYLTTQSKHGTTYASNPLWQVVDGPWKLSSYTVEGYAKFVPNTRYSGPGHATISAFVEEPFSSTQSEFNLVKTGKIDYGYVPFPDVPSAPEVTSRGYRIKPWLLWGINYFPLNFNNPALGAVFKQLYFRQALQTLINQQGYIHAFLHGYGVPDYGPVPLKPKSPFLSPAEETNHYPYDPARAKSLLSGHGWAMRRGVDVCTRPGNGPRDCGAGVAASTALNLSMLYASGDPSVAEEMSAFKSDLGRVGVRLNLHSEPFNSVIANAVACKPSQATCSWQLAYWGGGWAYGVDPFPSGEELFLTGATSNFGNYSSPTANRLIEATLHSGGKAAEYAYEDYLARQLPVIWMPRPDVQISAITSSLRGALPQSPITSLTPELWALTK
jgi:peptide/nickel transport system substrate-binding protein